MRAQERTGSLTSVSSSRASVLVRVPILRLVLAKAQSPLRNYGGAPRGPAAPSLSLPPPGIRSEPEERLHPPRTTG